MLVDGFCNDDGEPSGWPTDLERNTTINANDHASDDACDKAGRNRNSRSNGNAHRERKCHEKTTNEARASQGIT